MTVLLIGLSHRTTSVELREQFHLAEHETITVLREVFQAVPEVAECVILSTCNRFEIYLMVEDTVAAQEAVLSYLCQIHEMSIDTLRPHFYTMQERLAVTHLMRVASGLDSMILGEPQILGQVADALSYAQTAGTISFVLNRLFSDAVHSGKRARTETAISQHSTSVSHAAARLIQQQVNTPLSEASILMVGVGEMSELAAEALLREGASNLKVINRTFDHARQFAEKFNATPYEWSYLWDMLTEVDVVVTATGAPHLVLLFDDMTRVVEKRHDKPLILVDVAVPRNIDPEVDQLTCTTRYDIDDLQHMVDDNIAQRRACIPNVEAIITEEESKYVEWLNSRTVAPIITELRQKVQAMAEEEVRQALNRLDNLQANEQAIVQRLANRIVNKVLHEPTIRLKESAANGDGEIYAGVVRDLFALGENDAHA